MSKADRIRATAKMHPSWSTKEIGAACGCSADYVRAVQGRAKNPGRDAEYQRAYYWQDAEAARRQKREYRAYRAQREASHA
jgi:hypothetical protein